MSDRASERKSEAVRLCGELGHWMSHRDRQDECPLIERALTLQYRAGLLDAIKDVCMYCAGRSVGRDPAIGPNEAGNWTHGWCANPIGSPPIPPVLCAASALHARLAAMDGGKS